MLHKIFSALLTVALWYLYIYDTVDSKLNLDKKSLDDGPRAPTCLLLKIRGQRKTQLVALLSMVHQFKKWLLD